MELWIAGGSRVKVFMAVMTTEQPFFTLRLRAEEGPAMHDKLKIRIRNFHQRQSGQRSEPTLDRCRRWCEQGENPTACANSVTKIFPRKLRKFFVGHIR